MLSRILADSVLFLHFAFVIFVIFGGFLVAHKPWIAWLHIPMVLWSSIVNLLGWVCPLTPLENLYRSKAGREGYQGGFIEHYIAPIIYPEGLSYEMGVTVGGFVFIWNILIYTYLIQRHRGKRS